jgi:hypothetical protein
MAGVAAGAAALALAAALAIRYDVPRQLRSAFAPAVRSMKSSVDEARTAAGDAATKLAAPQTSQTSPPDREKFAAPPPDREKFAAAPAQPSPPGPSPAPKATATATAKAPARPTPARPATVELLLKSSPAGARVVRLDTKERLGRTPLRLDVPRKSATIWIEMTLDGWRPVRFAVDLRKDNTATVEFLRASKKTSRR